MKESIKFVVRPVAIAVAGALSLYGCLGGDGGVAGGSAALVAGAAANSPIDGAPLKVTCADGTAGGSGTTIKGSYTVAVSCASTNYPIVIEIDETALSKLTTKPTMAGPDMQFGTSDDETYDTASRAALRVAVESSTVTSANMNAVTTLAAQTIKDKIDAVVAKTAGATKPTAADVQTAESNTQTALGISTAIKASDPVKDSSVARVNAQVLEAVAVTTALAGSTVKPGDVMKEVANAAAAGKAVTKTEADGGKSFDITTATGNLSAGAVKTAMTSAAGVESAIKAKGTAMEQVAKVIGAIPSAQTFDPAKANLSSLATDIKAELAKTANAAANTASINAKVASEAIKQAVVKAKEIDSDTTIASGEKDNRKKAAFEAAESIRTATEKDVSSATTALTADQKAQAIAKVSMAVQVAANQVKTAAIGDIVDTTTNKPKASVAGLAEKIRTDVGTQIAAKTETQLGDLKSIDASKVLGTAAMTTIQTAATNVVSALKDYVPPAGASTNAVMIGVNQVIASMGSAVDPATVKTTLQNTITDVVNNLATALTSQVTVGGVTTTMNQLSPEQQTQLMAQTAANMIGTTPLDFAAPPTIGSVTTALNTATTTVNTTVVTSDDAPDLDKTTLTDATGTINTPSCSTDVTVSSINVGVPIKVTATANGTTANISAGDQFGTPPQPGSTTQPTSSGLKVFVKVNGGALPPFFPNPNGQLVGALTAGQKFALCVVPAAADTNYVLKAEVGSMYDFTTMQFKDSAKVKSITFSAKTPATTTTTTTTTAAPTTTTTGAATTSTASATTSTAAATTTTASTTTTTAAASFAGICQVKAGNVVAFVTNVPTAADCKGSGGNSLGFDAMSATVTSVAAAGAGTSVAWTALGNCDPFGAPPAAGATTGTPCKN